MENWLKENWVKIGILILVILFFGNYLYTYSGFVAYTEAERRGCALLEDIFSLDTPEQMDEAWDKLSQENKEITKRYFNQLIARGRKCKPIQQFYLEQGLITLLGTVLILRKKVLTLVK